MPKLWPIQTNFTGGQISSTAWGRVDTARYAGSVREMTNVTPLLQGGASMRGGIKYSKVAALAALSGSRLVPFVYDSETAYILEFTPNLITITTSAGGAVVTTIATPYSTTAAIDGLRFAQYQNNLIVVDGSNAPYRLQRFSSSLWRFSSLEPQFNLAAQAELGQRPTTTITLSSLTIAGTVTAGAGITFLASDVGRQIRAGAGIAKIILYTSATQVSISITQDFDQLNYASQAWAIYDTPLIDVTPSKKDEGDTGTLTATGNCWRNVALGYTYEDIGSYVWINGGIVEITGVVSSLVANMVVRRALASTDPAFGGAWQLKIKSWSSVFGWPRAVAIHEGRLFFASTTSFPSTVWGSETNNILNFAIGVNDSDPIEYTIGSDRNDQIMNMAASNVLYVLTYGSEYTLTGTDSSPITPTSIWFRKQTTYGSGTARPALIGSDLYFVQRSGRRVRRLAFDAAQAAYDGEDITILAEDVLRNDDGGSPGLKGFAHAQEPNSILWCVTNDYRLASCNINILGGIFAWAEHDVGGQVVSVASVPHGGEDRLFLQIYNPRDSTSYIGYLDETIRLDYSGEDTSALGTVKNIPHLAGLTASCVGDGAYLGEITADGAGFFELPVAVETLQAGYKYSATIELLPVEFPIGGSIQGRGAAASRCYVRLRNTKTITIEALDATTGLVRSSQQIVPRDFGGAALTNKFGEFTGDVETSMIGWEKSQPRILFKQTVPLPFTVLAIVKVMTVND